MGNACSAGARDHRRGLTGGLGEVSRRPVQNVTRMYLPRRVLAGQTDLRGDTPGGSGAIGRRFPGSGQAYPDCGWSGPERGAYRCSARQGRDRESAADTAGAEGRGRPSMVPRISRKRRKRHPPRPARPGRRTARRRDQAQPPPVRTGLGGGAGSRPPGVRQPRGR